MTPENHSRSECPARTYLQRPAEGLTVNGYRNWVAGYMTQNNEHWQNCRKRFVQTLGSLDGELAHQALGNLVRNLGNCAICPLKCYAPNSDHLGSDECLLLGLVAAIQYGDDEALKASANALSCASKCNHIIGPASEYAAIMKSSGTLLLPIPASVIMDIYLKSQQPENHSNITLH